MSRLKRQRVTADGDERVTASDDTDMNLNSEAIPPKVAPTQAKEHKGRSLFVRSLPASVTTESLTDLFSQSFPLKHALVVVDPVTKNSRGFGFVTFADVEDALSAQETFDQTLIEGRKIKVEFAERRQRQINEYSIDRDTEILVPKKQKPEVRPSSKLIVRNLPWTIKEVDLAALFRSYGKVKHATIPSKKAGLAAGFGFVVLRGRKNAEKALEGVNGKQIEGRTLAVDWAVEKEVWASVQADDKIPEPIHQTGDHLAEIQNSKASEPEDYGDGDDGDEKQTNTSDSEVVGSEAISDHSEAPDGGGDLKPSENEQSTLFIRNLPFSCTDEILKENFQAFGAVKYAKVVMDQATERSKGTAFVCFVNAEDADACIKQAPRMQASTGSAGIPKGVSNTSQMFQSLLEDTSKDTTGRFTLDGRVLQVSRAVDRREATRLTSAGNNLRDIRDKDRRRLYLLSEGTVPADSPLYDLLSTTEVKMREDSARQRQSLIKSNPALHLSLTRLSIRNLPRNITSKDLKALAREAVVGFAKEVKSGARKPLSSEERARGGEEMREAEKARKLKGRGIVKQATVHFEGWEGGKVAEKSGAGRSRGFGFVEYTSHQWALKGLRWLNGHAVDSSNDSALGPKNKERKKRLIVEFAIDNVQVVERRREREAKARERSKFILEKREKGEALQPPSKKALSKDQLMAKTRKGMKRKRSSSPDSRKPIDTPVSDDVPNDSVKASKRQQIIGRKRMMRKSRNKPSPG